MIMDKQQAADVLQKQLEIIPSLFELNPDHSDFKLWKENCLTIFKEIFPENKDWQYNFEWQGFRVLRVKMAEEVGYYSEEDKAAYEEGLQNAEVTIKAALNKLELFGIKPHIQTSDNKKGLSIQITNNLSNQQSVNVSVSFDQILQCIKEGNYSDDEKKEASEKVNELQDELKNPNPAWEKIKSILVWLLEFSKEVFIKVLPYILDKYTK